MAFVVTAGAKPGFFTRNLVNQDSLDFGTLTASENNILVKRLIDGDPLSLLNDTSFTQGAIWTLTMSLSEKSLTPGLDVDLILFQNINWKNFLVEFSIDGGTVYNTVPGGDFQFGTADFASLDFQLALASTLASVTHIKVTITHVQAAFTDFTKFIGGVIVAGLVLQTSRGLNEFLEGDFENKRVVILGDGSPSEDYWLRSAQSHVWWTATFSFLAIPKTETDSFKAIRASRQPFIFYPRPGNQVRDCYQCRFIGEIRPELLKPATLGVNIPLTVREVRA